MFRIVLSVLHTNSYIFSPDMSLFIKIHTRPGSTNYGPQTKCSSVPFLYALWTKTGFYIFKMNRYTSVSQSKGKHVLWPMKIVWNSNFSIQKSQSDCNAQSLSQVTLCDPMNCSPPGSSVHGISQARILDWVAIFSSRGSSWPRDGTCVSGVSCVGRQVLYHQHHDRPDLSLCCLWLLMLVEDEQL